MTSGFVRARGTRVVNGKGEPFLLRGVGLGSWLLPEGYMWKMPPGGDRPRKIEKMILDLIGPDKAREFWRTYRDRYISRDDIRRIAAEGFNSIRIPLNYRNMVSDDGESFDEALLAVVDRMIRWCRDHGLYVILDLHGAPGGQTGANIDDSLNDLPELFTVEENRRRTVEIWRFLATRYRDETCIAGYDLLNEPLPDHFARYNHLVMPLYRDIIRAIREGDPHHMIILEGLHWATDWSIFTDKPDDNLMLQFHKYWNNPDAESLKPFLDKRRELDVPIFMGEGGENNIDWYTGAFRLFEDLEISWNFWTWKKMDTTNSPCTIDTPRGWEEITGYLEGSAKPGPARAEAVLWEYLDNMEFRNCRYRPEVVNALFRRPSVRIPAAFYNYQGEGEGFGIIRRRESTTGFRSGDGTDIRFITGSREKANFAHGQGQPWQDDERLGVVLAEGEWLAWDFTTPDLPVPARYTLVLALAAPEGPGKVEVFLEGSPLGTFEVKGADPQEVTAAADRTLEPGPHRIRAKSAAGLLRVEWIEIKPVSKGEIA